MSDFIAQVQPWQAILALAAYIGYLFLVLGGGRKSRPVTARKLLSVPLVMGIATIAAFDGMTGPTSWVMLAIAVAIAIVQGILLGNTKILEEIDGTWCVRHDRTYLAIWFAFYGLKVALTALVVVLWQGEFHLWFGVFYFFVFSSLRSAIVFARYRRAASESSAKSEGALLEH